MRDLLVVLKIARRHAAWLWLAAASMVAVAGATVFAYNLVRPLYDRVLGAGPTRAAGPGAGDGFVGALDSLAAVAQARLETAVGSDTGTILALVLAAVVVKNLFAFFARLAVARFGLATIRDLRDRLFDALLGQSPAFFLCQPSGTLIARVVSDVQLVNEALSERFGDLVQDTLLVAALMVYVFALEPRLALGTLVVAPLLLAPVVGFSRRLRRQSRRAQECVADLTGVLDETVKGIRVVQAFAMDGFVAGLFRAATRRNFAASLKARAVQAANGPVMEVVGAIGALALIAYAADRIERQIMTLGDLSAFLVAVYGAYNPVKRLNKFNLALQQAVVAAGRVNEILAAEVTVRERPGAVELDAPTAGLCFEDVWFAYEGERWVLRGIDLEVAPGEVVALVGPSGGGKSTIVQLASRFWDVQRGRILVGGRDVREVTLASLRRHIGLVAQETVLFNVSVRANLCAGRSDVPEEALEAAARAARAEDFVRALPAGYDSVVGEAGMTLSGGQRQRLAVARAMLKNAPVLILDEATSALDAESEAGVNEALGNLMRGRATLVVAHRLATVRRADRILVVDGGRVVERGTHEELMAAAGAYRRMVEMQQLG